MQGGRRSRHPASPREALALLAEGNGRHQRGELELHDHSSVGEERARRQEPFAAIIACSDSRVSPTLVFDLEPGNLFVSRVAGNGIDNATLGSTEYAIKVLGVKLVVILGHTDCGAVKAAMAVAEGTASYPPEEYGAIGAVIDRLVPAIEAVAAGERTVPACAAANADAQAAEIASREPIVKSAVDGGRIAVAAAVYDLATRQVSFREP